MSGVYNTVTEIPEENHFNAQSLNLYGGMLLFCGFVLYDIQLVIEKARNGDDDYIWHSVDLFLEFINIFRRLLIILANKEDKKKGKN